ncbi:MAG TPA: dihydrofolate reductase family protein [Jatrophihabitantaceae bacterium]|jgi:dihydrofolate reductase
MGGDGERLHAWLFASEDRTPANSSDAAVAQELVDNLGAVVIGRRTFDVGIGPWAGGTPFPVPCFVVTHSARPELTAPGGGVASAVQQAAESAGDRDVCLMRADVTQQVLAAGLLDEIRVHLVPLLLGGGTRLFEHLGDARIELERVQVVDSPSVTHLRYRVIK